MPLTPDILARMKAPGDHREGIWRGGVLQVKVTNACDLDCKNCSVAVGIAKKLKKLFWMTPEQYRDALRSLKGYTGVIGMFGGNPAIHPKFEEMCQVLREEVPDKAQRGIWCNHPRGKGAIMRETFNPDVSNLNVHGVKAAWDEFKRDWPESKPLAAGLHEDGRPGDPSRHGPIFGSMHDLGLSDEQMWEKVSGCYVNQTWSAEITVVDGKLLGYFCEVAATMAELTGDTTHGARIEWFLQQAPAGQEPWWQLPMRFYARQVEAYCTKCLIPMNGRKVAAQGTDEPEQYGEAWAPVFTPLTVAGKRNMKQVTELVDVLKGGGEPATKYLHKGVMRKE